ncbi:hypothetical protein CYMTET_28902, partial [Cymbomonas tetramitiformis]
MSGTGETACVEIDGCALAPCFPGVECTDISAPGVGAVCSACPKGYLGDGRSCYADVCSADPPPCSVVPAVPCATIDGGETSISSARLPLNLRALPSHFHFARLATRVPCLSICTDSLGQSRRRQAGARCPVLLKMPPTSWCPLLSPPQDATDKPVPAAQSSSRCHRQAGGYTCGACPSGYSGDGGSCIDIDECGINNGGCHRLSECTNIPGGHACGSCPEGYLGTSATFCHEKRAVCSDDNGGCDDLVTCVDTSKGMECGLCPEGYEGTGATGCTEIDGCLQSRCYPGVHCADIPAPGTDGSLVGHKCGACPSGMTGDGITCIANMCFFRNGGCDAAVSCTNNGDAPGGRVCGPCPAGFSDENTGRDGTYCEDIDGCKSEPCFPGVPPPTARRCCRLQWRCLAREGCNQRGDDSRLACGLQFPPLAGVACTDVPGQQAAAEQAAFRCGDCPAGYTGDGLQCADIDECSQDNGESVSDLACRARASTVGEPTRPVRQRMSARAMPRLMIAADPTGDPQGGCWSSSDGSVSSACTNSAGSFECGPCPPPMRGSGLAECKPTTDCAVANGGCWVGAAAAEGLSASCEQTELGSVCGACPEGFEGSGSTSCVDIDGCSRDPCFE